jgi:hypothetical protein
MLGEATSAVPAAKTSLRETFMAFDFQSGDAMELYPRSGHKHPERRSAM